MNDKREGEEMSDNKQVPERCPHDIHDQDCFECFLTEDWDRVARDALAIISGTGICTPAEGYRDTPRLLIGDLRQMAGRLYEARAERDRLRERLEPLEKLAIAREAEAALIVGISTITFEREPSFNQQSQIAREALAKIDEREGER